MDNYEVMKLVSDWGVRLSSAVKSQGRICSADTSLSEECREAAYVSMDGSYARMAKPIVGFTKSAPYSSATQASLAVVSKCPGCGELYWYHINMHAHKVIEAHRN